MPRELPRREVASPKERSYHDKEGELKKKVENTTRWSGVEKVPVTLTASQIAEYSSKLKRTVAELKQLADFKTSGGLPVFEDRLKQRTRNARGDLPGLWHDIKQEVASRSLIDVNLNVTLDWLELAEREGGLGTWLEQWNMLMAPGTNVSWDTLADCIGKIKQGIEFCKELVEEGFRADSTSKNSKNRDDLLLALDAIASEIARQADSKLHGNEVGRGKAVDALSERLKDVSLRAGIEDRLHSAAGNKNLHEAWLRDVPVDLQKKYPNQISDLSGALKDWKEKAVQFDALLSTGHQAQDELDGANSLDQVALKVGKSIDDLILPGWATSNSSAGSDPDQYSILLHVCARLVKELDMQITDFGKRLVTQQAKTQLNGSGSQKLLQIDFASREPKTSVYDSGRDFAKRGKLTDFWQSAKAYIEKQRNSQGLADAFEKAGGLNLKDLLTRWTERKPTETYALAWQLTATLRNLKQQGDAVLKEPTALAFAMNTVDAIADAIRIQVLNEADSI